jgi:hypothetical protein
MRGPAIPGFDAAPKRDRIREKRGCIDDGRESVSREHLLKLRRERSCGLACGRVPFAFGEVDVAVLEGCDDGRPAAIDHARARGYRYAPTSPDVDDPTTFDQDDCVVDGGVRQERREHCRRPARAFPAVGPGHRRSSAD